MFMLCIIIINYVDRRKLFDWFENKMIRIIQNPENPQCLYIDGDVFHQLHFMKHNLHVDQNSKHFYS